MSNVNQELVKMYFEMNGFLVKRDEQFLILNLKPQSIDPPPAFLIKSGDLLAIGRATVAIKGWHSDKFFPSRLRNSPEIFGFVQPEALKITKNFFGGNKFKKILIVSHLPAKEEMKKKSIKFLKGKGIDHILEFDSILKYLIRKVKPNHNYIKSDLLQLLRLLKCYHLLQEPQLELFK
ncbi:MAG: hypothetical protein GXO98_02405 [Nitrospirae bacterium]|nr:hypothetical protein [Nitrospirota bacterium]